jgi:hypothetical protein
VYEKGRELARLSIQKWTSNEVFSFQWFLMVGLLIVAYVVWLKLVDRKRVTELLLIGSLEAVAKLIIASILLDNILGLYEYRIRLLPVPANIFATSVTISPIIIMLVAQYTSSWKGFLLWNAIGNAFLNFVIFPVYTSIGIVKFYNWNVFYHFLVLSAVAVCVRVVFLWINGIQRRHSGTVS